MIPKFRKKQVMKDKGTLTNIIKLCFYNENKVGTTIALLIHDGIKNKEEQNEKNNYNGISIIISTYIMCR